MDVQAGEGVDNGTSEQGKRLNKETFEQVKE